MTRDASRAVTIYYHFYHFVYAPNRKHHCEKTAESVAHMGTVPKSYL